MKIKLNSMTLDVPNGSIVRIRTDSIYVISEHDNRLIATLPLGECTVLPTSDSAAVFNLLAQEIRSRGSLPGNWAEGQALRNLKRELSRFNSNTGRFKTFG